MKKIYNYLFPVFLSLFALAACDEDNEEIVPMSYTDPVATVTKIDPVEGYVGNEFTVSGSDFGIITEDVKVFIGSQEAVVVSCADDAILAKAELERELERTNGEIAAVLRRLREDARHAAGQESPLRALDPKSNPDKEEPI